MINTFGRWGTRAMNGSALPPHPIYYFPSNNGLRSRHLFRDTNPTCVPDSGGGPRREINGDIWVKTGLHLADYKEELFQLQAGYCIRSAPPTLHKDSGTHYYWDPAPWEIEIPELDRSLIQGGPFGEYPPSNPKFKTYL
jgi:hypothetical protein